MPLHPPKIFKLLEFWRPPEGCLFGVFMFKLIWSHYEPVTKISVVLMCLTTLILAFYQVFGRPPDERIYYRKRSKRRRKSKFRRRRLPYHCVMRCYSRTGNRPHRIGISRFESRRARRLKRRSRKIMHRRKLKMLRRRVKLSEDRALYEAWTTGSPPVFQLECPDIDLIKPILDKLGPGGINGGSRILNTTIEVKSLHKVVRFFPVGKLYHRTWYYEETLA